MVGKNIIIFLSSIRPNRMAERVGIYVKKAVEEAGMKVTMFDPLEMPFEMVRMPIHFYPPNVEAPGWLKEAQRNLTSANGFLIISSEMNSTVPPPLANMLHHFPPQAFSHRPCGLITYSVGGWGGCRSMMGLRTLVPELGMFYLPKCVSIPLVDKCFNAEGKLSDKFAEGQIKTLVHELNWYTDAITNHAKVTPIPKE